jgi:cytochrome P450
VSVFLGVLGAPSTRVPEIRAAMENQLKSLTFNPAVKPLFMAGWEVLWQFADDLVIESERNNKDLQDTLLDTLIAVKRAGQMDETELRFLLLVLLGGGYDTSKNILTLTMNLLLDRPDLYDQCAEDKELCGRVITEALRYFAITSPYRTAARDFSYGGFTFCKGDIILTATAMAGRDPAMFPDPLTFDPQRENARRHVAFGRGGHVCIGQFLARNQLQEGLHLIAQRLRRPRLNGQLVWRPYLGAWGLEELPIAFDPLNR